MSADAESRHYESFNLQGDKDCRFMNPLGAIWKEGWYLEFWKTDFTAQQDFKQAASGKLLN